MGALAQNPLVSNIYSQSNTIFTEEYFGKTKPIPIQKGTIQKDTPIFIILRTTTKRNNMPSHSCIVLSTSSK